METYEYTIRTGTSVHDEEFFKGTLEAFDFINAAQKARFRADRKGDTAVVFSLQLAAGQY